MDIINSAPLYSFMGYLLDEAKKVNKKVYAKFIDINGNVLFDGEVTGRDDNDSIIISGFGAYTCAGITRDMIFGYDFRVTLK